MYGLSLGHNAHPIVVNQLPVCYHTDRFFPHAGIVRSHVLKRDHAGVSAPWRGVRTSLSGSWLFKGKGPEESSDLVHLRLGQVADTHGFIPYHRHSSKQLMAVERLRCRLVAGHRPLGIASKALRLPRHSFGRSELSRGFCGQHRLVQAPQRTQGHDGQCDHTWPCTRTGLSSCRRQNDHAQPRWAMVFSDQTPSRLCSRRRPLSMRSARSAFAPSCATPARASGGASSSPATLVSLTK